MQAPSAITAGGGIVTAAAGEAGDRGRGKNLGHTGIRASFRHAVTFEKRNGRITMTGQGNLRSGVQIQAEFGGDHELDLRVLSVKTLAEVEEAKQAGKRQRDTEKGNAYAQVTDWLIANHPTVTKAEAGRLIAAKFRNISPKAKNRASAIGNSLSTARRGLGGFLELVDGHWQRKGDPK